MASKSTIAKQMRAGADIAAIRRKLGHLTLQWSPAAWFDTGSPDLNRVLGHPAKGIAYGRMIEISGRESHGKTALVLSLAAIAQSQGATVIWLDYESSFSEEWAIKRGLQIGRNLVLIQPYIGTFGKEKSPRLSTAQELLTEAEAMMLAKYQQLGERTRLFVVVDSIASMLVDEEAAEGLEDRKLRTKMALPSFLGGLFRRWVGLAQAYQAIMIFINQLRQNPVAAFGDPWYTPGGNAPKFYCHVRARLRRAKGGRMIHKGRVVGIQGILRNLKNKAGGEEGLECGYKILFEGPIQVLPVSEMETVGGKEA